MRDTPPTDLPSTDVGTGGVVEDADDGEVRAALLDALEVFAGLVREPVVAAAWGRASDLEGYTVGGLCGHVLVAVGRLEPFLREPAPPSSVVVDPIEFYARATSSAPGANDSRLHVGLRAAGEQAGAAGPDQLGERFDALCASLAAHLSSAPADLLVPVVTMPGSASLLGPYLRTRLIELVVHADDVAVSVGIPTPSFPLAAYEGAAGVLVGLAARHAGWPEVIRAFARQDRVHPDSRFF